jgi:2,4-diketo-3-deoxy-L-fuconate hydrolase
VNGLTRQNSTTAQVVFDVPFLVSYVSQFMTLLPADVISTAHRPVSSSGMKP